MAFSTTCIAKLDAAEKKADNIIEEAKKNRKVLLNKAREAAEVELKAFAAKADSDYQALIASQVHGDDSGARKAQTERELSEVEADFQKHSDRTVAYVVEKVLDVPLHMSSTQKQALIATSDAGPPPVTVKLFGPDSLKAPGDAPKAPKAPASPLAVPEPPAQPRGASVLFDDEDMKAMGGGWGGNSATITLKSLKATIGDKKMDAFVEVKYAGRGVRSQVVKNGGREAVFDEELESMDLTPDAELVFSVGDFDKKDGKVSKEPVGDTKPIKLEELATDDDGVFEGSFELFRQGRAKNTGKLFVRIDIA